MWAIVVICDCAVRGVIRLRQTGDTQGYWLIAAFAAVVGLLVQGRADVVWYRPTIQTLWWLCVAIIASFYRNTAVEEPLLTATEEN